MALIGGGAEAQANSPAARAKNGAPEGRSWLEHFLKLQIIRQAAIPLFDAVQKQLYTPLLWVDYVRCVEILAAQPANHFCRAIGA